MRLVRLLIVAVLLLAICMPAYAQATVKETDVLGYNGYTWNRLAKGELQRGGKMVYFEDFLGYSNTTTGVAVLAGASAPQHDSILTPVDWFWGTTLSTGTVKLKADINGIAVLDTGHAAQNDAAAMNWREANFGIGYKPIFEAYLFVSSITNCVYEAGFYVDANDCAMFRIDSAVSATKWLTVYENNNGGEVVYTTAKTVAGNTWYHLKVAVSATTGTLEYSINGVVVKSYTTASTLRNVAFKPHFSAKVTDAGHAATKTMTVDWVKLTQDRATQ